MNIFKSTYLVYYYDSFFPITREDPYKTEVLAYSEKQVRSKINWIFYDIISIKKIKDSPFILFFKKIRNVY